MQYVETATINIRFKKRNHNDIYNDDITFSLNHTKNKFTNTTSVPVWNDRQNVSKFFSLLHFNFYKFIDVYKACSSKPKPFTPAAPFSPPFNVDSAAEEEKMFSKLSHWFMTTWCTAVIAGWEGERERDQSSLVSAVRVCSNVSWINWIPERKREREI
jgi:hypothetical protein